MDDLNDLASAANQARPYRRGVRVRARPKQRSSAPLVAAIVFGSIIICLAIIYLATRSGSGQTSEATSPDSQNIADDANAKQVTIEQVHAQVVQFKDFAGRLANALSNTRKSALQAESNPSDLVVKYTCQYLLGHLGTHNSPSGRPTEFLAQFSGTYEGIGEGYHSKDTTEINAAFVLDPAGRWKISSASERPITHSTSTDFMGVPEKGGPKRDIANIDWFNAAVAEAQKAAGS